MQLRRRSIIRAAIAELDERGISDLSMRRLGAALKVQPGALYWHVKDKEQLIALIADELLRPITEVYPHHHDRQGAYDLAQTLFRTAAQVRDGAAVVRHAFERGTLSTPVSDIFTRVAQSAGAPRDKAGSSASAIINFTLAVSNLATLTDSERRSEFDQGLTVILNGVFGASVAKD